MAHPGGRPLKFQTPEEMQVAIDAYYAECENRRAPLTMSGLALAIGFENRQSLLDYKKKTKFSGTINKAKAQIERSVEELMLHSNGVVAGIIFNAKNNFGWHDKKELDHTTKGEKMPAPILGGAAVRKDAGDTGN